MNWVARVTYYYHTHRINLLSVASFQHTTTTVGKICMVLRFVVDSMRSVRSIHCSDSYLGNKIYPNHCSRSFCIPKRKQQGKKQKKCTRNISFKVKLSFVWQLLLLRNCKCVFYDRFEREDIIDVDSYGAKKGEENGNISS